MCKGILPPSPWVTQRPWAPSFQADGPGAPMATTTSLMAGAGAWEYSPHRERKAEAAEV